VVGSLLVIVRTASKDGHPAGWLGRDASSQVGLLAPAEHGGFTHVGDFVNGREARAVSAPGRVWRGRWLRCVTVAGANLSR
jgi:hypothetical protein